jgi:hypothetical protein
MIPFYATGNVQQATTIKKRRIDVFYMPFATAVAGSF